MSLANFLFFQVLRWSGQFSELTAANIRTNVRVNDLRAAVSSGFGKQKTHNFYGNPKSSHNSVCPFSANSMERDPTAQTSFLDCQEFPLLLLRQKFY
jgi:hypothetical protein